MRQKDHLIGRQREHSELLQAFESARQGKGGMVLLAGEAGVGKTRLAEACLAQNGLMVCTGRATEAATPPYGPITAALRDYWRQTPGGQIDCGPLTSYLALLLPEMGQPSKQADRETLIEAISAALVSIAQHAPSAIFFDDLQWADNATLELFPALAERCQNQPLLILGTYRSDEIPRGHRIRWLRNELRRARRLNEISLKPLNREETALLLERVLEATPTSNLIQLIYERTQGVPLFVEELASALSSGGRIRHSDSGAELIPGEDLPMPESVRDAVLLRMDALSGQARKQLEVAAVAGMEFDLQIIAELSGAEAGLDELFDRNFIIESKPGFAAFRHALTREAILSEVQWSQRRTLNRQIAVLMEMRGASPEVIAEHWLAANALDRARQALVNAADHSCHLHAYRDAARAAHRALEIWPAGEDEEKRLQALERLAHCAQVSGQLSDAVRALREVVESPHLKADRNRLGEAQRSLATVYGLQGAWEQSLSARLAAAQTFESAGLKGEAAVEWLAAAGRYTATIRYTTALETVRRALRFADEAERWDTKARAMALEGNVLAMMGKAQEGRQIIQAALSLALHHNLTEAASVAYYRLALALEYSSEIPAAREAFFTAYDFCQNQGSAVQAQICLGCMAYVFYRTGEWKRALETCRVVTQDQRSPADSTAGAVGLIGMIRAHRGETRQARKYLQDSLTLSRRANATAMELIVLGGLAVVEEDEGAAQSAEKYYREFIDLWRKGEDRHDAIAAMCAAATFFATRGFEKETALCAEALAAIASATGNPEALAALAYALGETALLHGNAEEAARQFAQALAHMEKLEIPLERAKFEYRTGFALARADSKKAAIEHLRNAYRLARKLGARPLAGKVADELNALGETTEERRSAEATARANQAGLTQRQLEIARLMAAGLTNKGIAQKLFLSPRTVDMHVSHLLNRLDCRTRTEAVSKAGELGLLR